MSRLIALFVPVFVVTAYTWTGNPTASGSWPTVGVTVACPKPIPLGATVWIEGVGIRTCQDRGGKIRGKRLDLYVADSTTANLWGRRSRRVVVQ